MLLSHLSLMVGGKSIQSLLSWQQVKVAICNVMMKITDGAEMAPGVELFGCQMSVFSFIIVF